MGAIDQRAKRFRRDRRSVRLRAGRSASLKALSFAALALPGLAVGQAQAQEWDGVDIQETHYREGKHDIIGVDINSVDDDYTAKLPQNLKPIVADSLHISSRFNVFDRFRAFINYTQDTWSGASAVATAPAMAGGNWARYAADGITITGASPYLGISAGLIPLRYDRSLKNIYAPVLDRIDNRKTLVMSSASPETREQVDGKLRYEWDNAALDVGGGISEERDYRSRFGNIGGKFDFNQKLTTLSWGASFTTSNTHATLDPDGYPFFDVEHYVPAIDLGAAGKAPSGYADMDDIYNPTRVIMRGDRKDLGGTLGLTQVLNKDAVASIDAGYTRSTGYLANPYKTVLGHTVQFLPGEELGTEILYNGTGGAFLEVRPEERNLFTGHFGIAQYVEPLDAAFHFDYTYAHDDWGIDAHTFKAQWAQPFDGGWLVTPSVRYYTQSAADFYTTGIFQTVDENRQLVTKYPKYFSSDTRLSGFGTLSAGVTVSKEILSGVSLETSFEYFTHQGDLKLGGGGEEDFADYNYWTLGAALKITPSAITSGGHGLGNDLAGADHSGHKGHEAGDGHQSHHGGAPAGVMFDHALAKAGDYMVGYSHQRGWQSGDILSGTHVVDLAAVRTDGCSGNVCAVTPDRMRMQMHMLHLMYAPTDWLTLMAMPQYMSMNMDMLPNPDFVPQNPGGHGGHHTAHHHETGSIGDTGLYAMFKVVNDPHHQLTLALGGTAPTGDIDFMIRKTGTNPVDNIRLHYGMQTGSGTWDFIPSLTYVGAMDAFSWGAQATGTVRGGKNDAGYALGNIFQASLWGGYKWSDWLTTTVRGIYTTQGAIRGAYAAPTEIDPLTGEIFIPEHVGPFDQPGSYGGQFWDLGLGVNMTIAEGSFAGNTLKFEWLQPLQDDVNGFQLERKGTFVFNWSTTF